MWNPTRFQRLQWKFFVAFLLNSLLTAAVLLVLSAVLMDSRIQPGPDGDPGPLLLILCSALAVGLCLGLFMSQRLRRRFQVLKDGAVFLANGNLSHRIPAEGGDEVADIAAQWNRMAARLENQVGTLQKLISQNKELADQRERLAIVDERQRLARDLHDSVSQHLFAISMMASAMVEAAKRRPETLASSLKELDEVAVKAQTQMRALLLQLRPAELEEQTLTEALEQLLRELENKHPIRCKREWSALPSLHKGMEEHLYRIVQEALSNVLRHSGADEVWVRLQGLSQQLLLVVEDNGKGFTPDQEKISSYGLTTMRERTQEMGGTFRLVPLPEKGTRLEIRIPYVRTEERDEYGHSHPDRR
ncbi:sensor histidine kinase [Desmospora profundinema]|uniref:histidine kinase n=1 Tax=Desmospora profundinema TaxID=1571184 RepID=A0ABU1IRA2_9BACL|nr:histidine kinase [Desmospora profundinema]MDR6227322.1 NarL family two-component system sensor histidine kinase LiaS [Desmospora profundinema]